MNVCRVIVMMLSLLLPITASAAEDLPSLAALAERAQVELVEGGWQEREVRLSARGGHVGLLVLLAELHRERVLVEKSQLHREPDGRYRLSVQGVRRPKLDRRRTLHVLESVARATIGSPNLHMDLARFALDRNGARLDLLLENKEQASLLESRLSDTYCLDAVKVKARPDRRSGRVRARIDIELCGYLRL